MLEVRLDPREEVTERESGLRRPLFRAPSWLSPRSLAPELLSVNAGSPSTPSSALNVLSVE